MILNPAYEIGKILDKVFKTLSAGRYRNVAVEFVMTGIHKPGVPAARIILNTGFNSYAVYDTAIANPDDYEKIDENDREVFVDVVRGILIRYGDHPYNIAIKIYLEEADEQIIDTLIDNGFEQVKNEDGKAILIWFNGDKGILKTMRNMVDEIIGDIIEE